MCGIVGFFNPQSDTNWITAEVLDQMTKSLQHRGPDAHRIVFKKNWGFGHRRLKVIDLSDDANQPMFCQKGQVCLVFNGEIYNYLTLKKELVESGYRFRTTSDTEVVLLAYEKWGKECFNKFNGMFSIAIFDTQKKQLTIAIDRLGKKPLYYTVHNGSLIFASEIKVLLALSKLKREISLSAIHQYLLFNYIPEPLTIIKEIFKLPSHHILTYSTKGLSLTSYWNIGLSLGKNNRTNTREYNDHKRDLDIIINDAVKLRLNSDVPLGLFLSGGIDSSLIGAIAAKHQTNINTFSVNFHQESGPSRSHAKDIAKYIGTNHRELFVDPSSFMQIFNELPKYSDEPFGDDSLIPSFFLAKETRKHVTVALSGDGGDELFCGYPKYRWLNSTKELFMLPYWLRKYPGLIIKKLSSGKLHKLGDFMASNMCLPDTLLWMSTTWKIHEVKELLNFLPASPVYPYSYGGDMPIKDQLLNILSLLDIESFLKDDILVKIDRSSMANSLEVRSPLLDYRVVEFALSLPTEFKLKKGKTKIILKDLLADYIPLQLHEKSKIGFNIPLKEWLHGELRPYVEEYLSPAKIGSRGIFNWKYIEKIKKSFFEDNYDFSRKLYNLLVLEKWLQHYKISL